MSITLSSSDNGIRFTMKNAGQGIAAEAQAHIFDKFYQADTSHATEGNGLGLALVKTIVELHGGEIRCRSDGEEWTEFEVHLPMNEVQ